VLVVVFGAAFSLGAAVGPVDPAPVDASEQDGHSPTVPSDGPSGTDHGDGTDHGTGTGSDHGGAGDGSSGGGG
jgi:hypothetical protein